MVRAPYRAVKNRVAGFGKYERPYLFRFQVPRAGAALGFPAKHLQRGRVEFAE